MTIQNKMLNEKSQRELKSLIERCKSHEESLERKLNTKITKETDLDDYAEELAIEFDYHRSHEESIADFLLQDPYLFNRAQDSTVNFSPGETITEELKNDTTAHPEADARRGSDHQEAVPAPTHTTNKRKRGRPRKSHTLDPRLLHGSSNAGRRDSSRRRGTSRAKKRDPTKQQDPFSPVVSVTAHHGGALREGGHAGHGGTGCYHCGSPDLVDDSVHGDIVCTKCGTCSKYISDHYSLCLPHKEQGNIQSMMKWKECGNSYDRSSYFRDLLNQLMGQQKQSIKDVPPEIYQHIKEAVRTEVFQGDMRLTTGPLVRKKMQELGYSEFYPHAHMLANFLSDNKNLTTLDHKDLDMLMSLFKKIQAPFEKFKGQRKNLLSYNYILWQFFMILGLSANCYFLNMPKCMKRVADKDRVWRLVCQETGLPFIPYINTMKKLKEAQQAERQKNNKKQRVGVV